MRDTSFVSPANPARLECHDLGPVRNPLDQFTENLPGVYVRPLDSLELTGKIMASKQLTRSIHYMLGTGLTLAARDPEKYVLQILETLTFVQNPIILPSPPLRHVILCGPQTCELDRRKNFLEHGLSTLYSKIIRRPFLLEGGEPGEPLPCCARGEVSCLQAGAWPT